MTKKEVTQLSYEITGLAIKVHKLLGPGLLESVYEKCLIWELQNNGYKVLQQQIVPIKYGNVVIEADLRLDIMVNDTVIIEVKAVEKLIPVFEAQLLTYMKLLEKPQGLLFNFHSENLTKSMIPLVNEYFKRLPD
ncbi:MAG: GxxExxY protein [Bacteroidetes bacterium]|nr:GxxExxY protein [Bacteroidota bacterium]